MFLYPLTALASSSSFRPTTGNAKITPERIGKLESIGFEWDPQKAQWDASFQKLLEFKAQIGHCKVPKVCTKISVEKWKMR